LIEHSVEFGSDEIMNFGISYWVLFRISFLWSNYALLVWKWTVFWVSVLWFFGYWFL